jgi:hypothetical protein
MQPDGVLGGIQVEVLEAPLRVRLIVGKRGLVTGDVPSGWLDFEDLRPELR